MANKRYSITAILGVDSAALAKGLTKAGKSIKDWAKKMDGAIRGAVSKGLKVAGVAVAGFTAASLREFASFEKGMNEVFTLLPGITKEAMEAMTGDVMKLSKELGVLPEEIVPALYQALSAGVPPDNVFNFLKTAVKGAKAGVAATGEAVDALSSVVNAYGKEALTAERASDIMFTTIRLGKTTYSELSGFLFNVAPAAAAAGVGFEDVAAAIAALTAQGVPTRVATTQIRQAILSMMAPNKQMTEAFMGTAHSAQDLADIMKEPGGLVKAMQLVEKTAAGNMTVMKGMYGSVEALQGVLALTSKEGKVFNDTLKEIQEGAGATDEAFKQMDQGLARSFEKMKSNLKVAMISFGKALMPLLEKVLPLIEELMMKFASIDWGDAFEKLAVLWNEFGQPTFDKLLEAVKAMPWKDLADQAKIFFTVLAMTVKQVTELIIKVLPAVIPVIKAVMGYYQLLMLRITIIATVIGELAEPIVAFITTVANAISGFFNLITNPSPEALEAFLKAVGQGFKDLLTAVLNLLGRAGGLISDVIKSWFYGIDAKGAASDIANGVVGGMIKTLKASKQMIVDFFTGLIDEISGFFSGAGTAFAGATESKLANVLKGMLEQVKGMIDGLIDLFGAVSGIVDDATELLGGMFEGIGDDAGDAMMNILDTAAAAYAKFYSMYLTVYEAIIKTVADLLKWARPLIKDLMAAYLNVVKTAVTGIMSLVEPAWEAFSAVVDFLKNTFEKVVKRIAPLIKGVLWAVLKYYTFVYNMIAMYIQMYVEIIKSAFRIIKNTLVPMYEMVIDIVLEIYDALARMVKAAWKIISDAFGKTEGASVSLKEIWEKVVLPAIKDALKWLEEFIDRARQGWVMMKPYLMDLISILETILTPIIKLIANLIVTIFKTLWPLLKAVVGAVGVALGAVWKIIKPVVILIKELVEGTIETIGALWAILVGIFTGDMILIQAGFETIGEALMDVVWAIWDVIKGVVGAIVDVVVGAVDVIWGILKGAWELIKGLFTSLYDFIYDILIGNSVTTIFKDCFEYVLGIIKGVFELITKILKVWFDFFTAGLELIRDIVKAVFDRIGKVIERVIDGIIFIIQSWFDMVKGGLEFIQSIVETVFGVIGAVVGAVFGTITAVAGAAFGVLKAGWEMVGDVAGAVWDGISGAASSAWDGITSVASKGQELLADGWNAAKDVAGGVWDGITGIVGGAWDGIKGIASKGQEILKAGWDNAKNVAGSIWDGITGIVGGAWDGIKGIAAKGQEMLSAGWNAAKDTASSVWSGIKGIAGKAWDGITATADAGVRALNKGMDIAKRAASNAWEGMKGTASKAWQKITATADAGQRVMDKGWKILKKASEIAWRTAKEGATSAAESAGLVAPEAQKGTTEVEKMGGAAGSAAEAFALAALEAEVLENVLKKADAEAHALNETADAFELASEGLTPYEMIAAAHEEQLALNETAMDHPFVKMTDAPKLELKMGGAIKPITSSLKSIDGTLKRIERTVGKKFVNQ